jgi:hypothetical protein
MAQGWPDPALAGSSTRTQRYVAKIEDDQNNRTMAAVARMLGTEAI